MIEGWVQNPIRRSRVTATTMPKNSHTRAFKELTHIEQTMLVTAPKKARLTMLPTISEGMKRASEAIRETVPQRRQ